MAKGTRIYSALVDDKIVGKRTTHSMFYQHAIVIELDTRLPKPFRVQDSEQFHVLGYSLDARNAEKTRAYQANFHTKHPYCVRVFVVPAVLIDKAGNRIEQVPA